MLFSCLCHSILYYIILYHMTLLLTSLSLLVLLLLLVVVVFIYVCMHVYIYIYIYIYISFWLLVFRELQWAHRQHRGGVSFRLLLCCVIAICLYVSCLCPCSCVYQFFPRTSVGTPGNTGVGSARPGRQPARRGSPGRRDP